MVFQSGLRQEGGSDPLADAAAALQNAVAAAQAFNNFAVQLSDFALQLTTQQVATIDQITLEAKNALDSINKARDAAIAKIVNAQGNPLYRPPEDRSPIVFKGPR